MAELRELIPDLPVRQDEEPGLNARALFPPRPVGHAIRRPEKSPGPSAGVSDVPGSGVQRFRRTLRHSPEGSDSAGTGLAAAEPEQELPAANVWGGEGMRPQRRPRPIF